VSHRFFAPDLTDAARDVTLPAGESAHLTRVLRLREGDAVEIFDGRGALHAGVVRTASPRATVVTVDARLRPAPEAPAPLVVAQGLLKGDAMDAVVRDATVLGATEVWPMTTRRTNVPVRAALAAQERWQRVAVAAAKQCGRAVLPRIAAVRTLTEVLADPSVATWPRLWLTEPSAAAGIAADLPAPTPGICLAIGPEGGWAPEEVDEAGKAGWRPWTMAPVTLRAEHMTLAALSVVRYAWEMAGRRRIT
jgi:16S rRNA (uracil1498-N3)-methyltransferase